MAPFRIGSPLSAPAICLLAFALFFQNAPAGGAWGREEGTYFLFVGFYSLDSDRFFDNSGEVVTRRRYDRQAAQFYLEYGVGRDWTTLLQAPVFRHSLEGASSTWGLGDLEFETQYRFWKKAVPLAAGLTLGLPVGMSDREDSLAMGDGEFDFQLSLYAARAFSFLRSAWSAQAGYQLRTNGYTDAWLVYTSYSFNVFLEDLRVELILRGRYNAGTPDVDKINPYLGFGEGVEYTSQGIHVSLPPFWETKFSIGYYSVFFGEARNIIAQAYLVLGLGFEF